MKLKKKKMVTVRDVKSKSIKSVKSVKKSIVKKSGSLCIARGCTKRSVFNFISQVKGIYCTTHKKPLMINVVARPCMEANCLKRPSFGMKGELPKTTQFWNER